MPSYTTELLIDFKKIQELVYWSKKWEVSPSLLMKAFKTTKDNSVRSIEEYLRATGFIR